jgi:aspartyl-tRNA synthetase
MTYAEAMSRYGSDKPDTRVLLELVELTDLFRSSGFKAFAAPVAKGGVVKCLPIHDAEALTRGAIDRLEAFVKKELGGKGLAWVRVGADGAWQSPIAKF